MTILCVPYHLDEYLPGFRFPLPVEPVTVREVLPDASRWARMAALHEAVADRVADQVWVRRIPTVLSADCMVALGTVAGVQRTGADPAVVWFDAHGDVQTMETSASGYEGGIPLRVLAGYRPDPATGRLGLRAIPEERLLLVDGRDLDPPEEEYLRASAVRRSEVAGIEPGMLPDGPLVLHVDLDVLDGAQAPGLLFPAVGGARKEELLSAVRTVLGTGRVAALSVGCTRRPDEELDADGGLRARLLGALVGAGT
jgi:arginase